MRYIRTMDYYLVIKRREVHGTPWVNPENIMDSERSLSQKSLMGYDAIYGMCLEWANILGQEVS